jgi:predicted RNA-binding protein associated with RNAse of E/G family
MKEDQLQSVTVIKLNPQGKETWRYNGRILEQEQHRILIEAYFNRSDMYFHGIHLRQNDRFIECYYDNRWYNIFEIYDHEDEQLKGWYCNITEPAIFDPGIIKYVDLALDILIYPNGAYLILDEDEFAALDISKGTRQNARNALNTLVQIIQNGELLKLSI